MSEGYVPRLSHDIYTPHMVETQSYKKKKGMHWCVCLYKGRVQVTDSGASNKMVFSSPTPRTICTDSSSTAWVMTLAVTGLPA